MQQQATVAIPATGYFRLRQIIGDRKKNIPAIIPVSSATWWRGVKSKRFPQPVPLSPGVTVWRVEDVLALIQPAAAPEGGEQ